MNSILPDYTAMPYRRQERISGVLSLFSILPSLEAGQLGNCQAVLLPEGDRVAWKPNVQQHVT